jgi:hypothetical protein
MNEFEGSNLGVVVRVKEKKLGPQKLGEHQIKSRGLDLGVPARVALRGKGWKFITKQLSLEEVQQFCTNIY